MRTEETKKQIRDLQDQVAALIDDFLLQGLAPSHILSVLSDEASGVVDRAAEIRERRRATK